MDPLDDKLNPLDKKLTPSTRNSPSQRGIDPLDEKSTPSTRNTPPPREIPPLHEKFTASTGNSPPRAGTRLLAGGDAKEERVLEELASYSDHRLHRIWQDLGQSHAARCLSREHFMASGKFQRLKTLLQGSTLDSTASSRNRRENTIFESSPTELTTKRCRRAYTILPRVGVGARAIRLRHHGGRAGGAARCRARPRPFASPWIVLTN
eukprot:1194579-Prorocentrum_minimum.AAC.1